MATPTQAQYAAFGEAVHGILEGYIFDSEGYTDEEAKTALAYTVQLAAQVYGIELSKDES